MEFAEILAQIIDLLAREKRLSYRALKLRFHLDDEYLEGLKEEIIDAKRLAVDEEGRVLVWTGDAGALSQPIAPPPQMVYHPHALPASPLEAVSAETASHRPEAERRQLTVLFCDLVDSTALSSQLDPEDLREVVRAYQTACAEVIQHFEGHIAQYLGDGLLVYFGYPQAHEDDAQRAVRTGLGIAEAMATLNSRLRQRQGVRLAVRVGIHTGLVVVGEMGGSGRQEQLALGDTPNIAARIQGLAAPDTVVISAATQQLIQGYFTCHALGGQTLKGVATLLQVYQVVRATEVQQRFDIAAARGLTPLVGREHEVGLLRERWAQVQAGRGHIVVLSGEAGIGKSRLVQVVKDEISGAATLRIEYRCSPYHQHSALYPVITHLERALAFHQDETPADRLRKLEDALPPSPLPLAEVVPLLAALLSLPLPEDRYPPLTLTPQRQKQKTLEALLTWLLVLTEQQPVLFVVEDLHWIDPSTLEFLTLLVEQGPTARLLALLTCRPEFQPPWGLRTHLTPIALQRLPQPQVEMMIARVTGGKALPPAVLQHVVTKTDGVPLFVEELTKTVLESGLLRETAGHYELTGPLSPLAIPATLHDSLMARLDRLATVKAVAQLGAVLGRTFTYEVLQAVAPLDEASLQQALARLVEAELLYQRGVPPQATYLFKHALIQEAAYQSLLRSTRQQYHQCLAQVLAERFPDIAETQPELVAHHYTEAGLSAQALPYWQRAGERANARSSYREAINNLTKGLELLTMLPDTPERTHQELALHIALGTSLTATKGWAAPEAEQVYTRARELCRQVGETVQLFPVLSGLWVFYFVRAELQTARELAEQCLSMAQRVQDPEHLPGAHFALGHTLLLLGELAAARSHVEQSIALYERPQPPSDAILDGSAPGMRVRPRPSYTTTGVWVAQALWLRGYPDQALTRSHKALALARELSYPFILAVTLDYVAMLHQFRRERHAVHEQAAAAMVICQEQDFAYYTAWATILQGWVLSEQGQRAEGMTQMRQGLAALRATGGELRAPYYLTLLAEAHGNGGRAAEGLRVLAEAHTLVEEHEERWWEAEVHRLRGVLLLRQTVAQPEEAETWLRRALDVARRQEAKSLELRAAMSLARLWQQQGKRVDAHQLLAEVYGWFTEGFDTADLQEARALLDTLKKE